MFKKTFIWIGMSQALILLLSVMFYKRIDLLSYINVSFIIGSILILISLTGYVINGRFFDIVFFSFQHIFSQLNDKGRRPLSQLVPQSYLLPFTTGIFAILLMLLSLFIYKN